MADIKKVEFVSEERPKAVHSQVRRVETQKTEATVTVPATQMKGILDQLASLKKKVEDRDVSKATIKKAQKFNPIYKLPIWNDKLVESVKIVKTQRTADNGKLTFDQVFEVKLRGDKETFTADLGVYGTMRKQVPAELVEYVYKKGEFDSKGNPVVDKYKVKIINWTYQDGKKVAWEGVPEEIVGEEYIVPVDLLNS